MAAHRYIDRICASCLALTLMIALLFVNGRALGLQAADSALGYESRLFDTARVHTVDIVMEDWEGFLETCENEEYALCTLVIDGEACQNATIRAKGNTSLTSVAAYGNNRYSFKVEFDHYDSASTYHGLDKLNLNNLIQDNTCMKDYLVYRLMAAFGAAAPLCSYVSITVNGESWGLYLAVEGVEDAFLRRNYGQDAGALYKPDSMSFGGGRGNGGGFRMEDMDFSRFAGTAQAPGTPEGADPPQFPPDSGGQAPGGMEPVGGMGSADVKLQYIDDDPDSYPNIFDNAKTDVTAAGKARLIAALKALSQGEEVSRVVDVEQVIRYFVVHGFVCNGDSYTGSMIHNYYLYEENGVLSMLPWDYNLAFGGFQNASASDTVNEPIDTPVSGSLEDRPMLAWIFRDETYMELYHRYYDRFLSQYLESGWCEALIQDTAALIAPYVASDPTRFCTYEEFEAGTAALEKFCVLRTRSVRGQLEGSIPATAQEQASDGSALVDAADLSLSDMGSMGIGGGAPGERPAFSPGQNGTAPGEASPPGWNGPAAGEKNGGGGSPAPAGQPSFDNGLLLAGSAAVLLAGLLFAVRFRRRG